MNEYIKCGEVLTTLTSEATALLIQHGEDAKTAELGGCDFAFAVLSYFSGQKVYFPKFAYDASRKRLATISEDAQATRQSASELAKKHSIPISIAYQVIKQTLNLAANSRDAHYVIKGIAIEATRILIKHGVAPSKSVVAARGFADELIARWGGQILSFPRLETIKAQKRAGDIVRQYQSGVSGQEIARRYGLSFVRVYQVIGEFCRKNDMEPPRERGKTNALVNLKRQILEMAQSYEKNYPERYALLKTAADIVAKAQKVKP